MAPNGARPPIGRQQGTPPFVTISFVAKGKLNHDRIHDGRNSGTERNLSAIEVAYGKRGRELPRQPVLDPIQRSSMSGTEPDEFGQRGDERRLTVVFAIRDG